MSTEPTQEPKSNGNGKGQRSAASTVENAAETPAVTGKIAIDYRGSVGRALESKGAMRDQKPVPHRISPLGLFWPENGTARLRLHPGVNLVDAKLWQIYTTVKCGDSKGHPQLMDKIKRQQVRVIESLPEDHELMEAMVARSIDHEGLRWLEEKEREGLNRPEVLTSIADRLAKAHPVAIRPGIFQGRVPNLKGTNNPQPELAMG